MNKGGIEVSISYHGDLEVRNGEGERDGGDHLEGGFQDDQDATSHSGPLRHEDLHGHRHHRQGKEREAGRQTPWQQQPDDLRGVVHP